MKKILFTVFAMCVMFAASAQVEQGTILVSGGSNLSFSSYDEDAGDFSELDLNVKGGYFIMDNLALGVALAYNKVDLKYSGAPDLDATTGFGLFGRYYVNGKIILGAGFNSVKQGDLSGSEIALEAGYAIFVNDAVAIEPALNYGMFGGDMDGSAFGLNVAISVYLGRGQ